MPTAAPCTIIWFRDVLRLSDNRAWALAAASAGPVIAIFVDETPDQRLRPLGGASRWWLHHSLVSLDRDLKAHGIPLIFFRGDADTVVPRVASAIGAARVIWSRRYGAVERDVDTAVKTHLKDLAIDAESCNDRLLYEPWEVRPQSGESFKVFTPFWKSATRTAPAAPAVAPRRPAQPSVVLPADLGDVSLDVLALLPRAPDWSHGLASTWTPGEQGARRALDRFIAESLEGYASGRDRPDIPGTSSLSPHLRFGEIGVRDVWRAVQNVITERSIGVDASKFLAELGWREFSYHLLFHQGHLATRCVQPRFETFGWSRESPFLAAWQHGRTGYPIIDAGMRQLWQIGWMHNRVRMITASFLVKHMLVDWRIGEAWFWDTLVDADPASNPASWQWVAGCGADAAPYFRIFNPVLQGQKFDPDGAYVRHWVPELAAASPATVHTPWLSPAQARKNRYPAPVIDLSEGRARALAALAAMPKA